MGASSMCWNFKPNISVSGECLAPAQSLIDFTTTVSCPDEEPVVTENHGFPLGVVGSGAFISPEDVTISGSTDDGAVKASWSFSRP